jgi:nicotinamide mononucleotide transporter
VAEVLTELQNVSIAEACAVALAVAYLILAIRQNVLCWLAAFVSSLIYLTVFYTAQLYMESALQIFYAAMAAYGYWQWTRGGTDASGLRITIWSLRQHANALTLILTASLSFGYLMSRTDAAFPYVDSFTTVAAIVTTYMVARKVLENWLYWFVIDSVSVYVYLERGLTLTALLFVVYLVLIVIGWRRWWIDWRASGV